MAQKPNENEEVKSEDQLKTLFEEEIKKPYYNVFYLDSFKLPYDRLDVSVIIPTYNRCPYKPGTLKEANNPLFWSVISVLLQKCRVKEIIIADDHSKDYTREVVKSFINYSGRNNLPPIIYVKSKTRLGVSGIRNLAAKKSSGKHLFFIDDDSFLAPYAIFGALYTLEELEKKGVKVGAINLPTYGRRSNPRAFIPKREIGVLDLVKGLHKANKDCFPQEYLLSSEGKFLNSELQILAPISIMNLNAIALCPKKVFEEVGGFSEIIIKRMEDREFGCKVVENGYQLFYQPDPKFQCVHGSYGLKTGQKFSGDDWFKKLDKSISLTKAMDICDNPVEDTGARINPQEFIYDYIKAFFCMVYERNRRGAVKWVEKVYSSFVKEGKSDLFGNPNIPVPEEKEREKIWIDAITEGLDFIIERENKEISRIKSTISELKKKGTAGYVLKIMSKL